MRFSLSLASLAPASVFFVLLNLPFASGASAQVPDTARIRQEAERRLGRGISQAEVIRRLQQSGLSEAQVRQRLAQAGYDPGLAEAYFAAMRNGSEIQGVADSSFVTALTRLGVLGGDSARVDGPELLLPSSVDSAAGPEVFGRAVFERATTQFAPLTVGPVDPGYRLGPGDEVTLVLTGDVELAYDLAVSREGLLVIPDVGQVSVNGLTLAGLEDRLYDRLGRVYSGVRRSADATTRFQVSLGRLRTNQIFVIGDVVDPGAKQVSSVGTVWNALFRAGGPTEGGTFRRVQVRRGDGLIAEIDLYDYLLRGDASEDIRLENGDRVFVPPAGPQVQVEGAVQRPAIYEVRPGSEGLTDVLAFAGGFEADAIVRRIQIDRILPPGERTPGRYRVLRDVDLASIRDASVVVPLEDGDIVRVFAVPDERRDRVWLVGAVNNPGVFEWSAGLTLGDLVERADGLARDAYTPRLQIYRRDPVDGSRMLLQGAVPPAGSGITLEDGDSIVVVSNSELLTPGAVEVEGFVKEPGVYPYAAGMSLRDLLLAAGGFTPGARVTEAELFRLPDPSLRTDTTALVLRVGLGPPDAGVAYRGAGEWPADLEDVVLERGDRIVIRRAAGYEPLGVVRVSGEVLYPGPYALTRRSEPVVEVLRRAGWLTHQAHPEGIRLVRDGTLVAVDIEDALENPASRSNIALEAGDSIHVSAYDPTVTVQGEVTFASKVLYRGGEDMPYYLSQSGGVTSAADVDRITISYPNGERADVKKFLWFERWPEVRPGSYIYVPSKPEGQQGFDWNSFLTQALTIASTTATLILAISQLNNN